MDADKYWYKSSEYGRIKALLEAETLEGREYILAEHDEEYLSFFAKLIDAEPNNITTIATTRIDLLLISLSSQKIVSFPNITAPS